ncbi:nucleomorphin-like isoform X2 [Asterias rubens]|uniref:nucleomorphin-like isoform X2 n=1 Tax=Asterias rubens TaxID=7604 RepID=UPI001455180F|nr:nucleomorphin-like isoform X2 [Asterias rubens]XP_033635921.1 nucleomorphin-like isoform X2 [Asterias rubens]
MVNVCSSYDMLHVKVKRNQSLVAKEKLTDLISRQGKPGIKEATIKRIRCSKYRRAFTMVYNTNMTARKQLLRAIVLLVRDEMRQFVRVPPAILHADATGTFLWNPILRAFQTKLQVLYAALQGAVIKNDEDNRLKLSSDGEGIGCQVPGLGIVLSSLVRMRSDKNNTIKQKTSRITILLGQYLAKHGTCSMVINALNSSVGLCPDAGSLRRLCKKHGSDYNYTNIFTRQPGLMETSDEEGNEEEENEEQSEEEENEEQSEEEENDEDSEKEASDNEEQVKMSKIKRQKMTSEEEEQSEDEQSDRGHIMMSEVTMRTKVKTRNSVTSKVEEHNKDEQRAK